MLSHFTPLLHSISPAPATAQKRQNGARSRVPGSQIKAGGYGRRGLHYTLFLLALLMVTTTLEARTSRYRLSYYDDPATSISIGFQVNSGTAAHVVYDVVDHGPNQGAYRLTATPALRTTYHGMDNVFVRLGGLQPATTYYFMVVDSEGASQRFSFETTPADNRTPLSIVAGGDSRNNRAVARKANQLVARLQPHFVLFGGDMTNSDTPAEWQAWLDDWQLTIGRSGRLTPIVPARGNHESSDVTIARLFDVPNPRVWYAITFGGDLLRTYTLNTMAPAAGDQLSWLQRDLGAARTRWKIAQYHHAMRPHTAAKRERDELIGLWGTQFYRHGMNLVIESDAHTVKQTYPLRPSREAGAVEGFVRDDAQGTVYVGEGCWGAPLRPNNDDKVWTRASGQFNQFKWLWVDTRQIQVRTVRIDQSQTGGPQNVPLNRFALPAGMVFWNAPNSGEVLSVLPRGTAPPTPRPGRAPPIVRATEPTDNVLTPDANGRVRASFQLPGGGRPEVLIVGPDMKPVRKFELPARGPGPYVEEIQLPALAPGKHELIIRYGGKLVAKYAIR